MGLRGKEGKLIGKFDTIKEAKVAMGGSECWTSDDIKDGQTFTHRKVFVIRSFDEDVDGSYDKLPAPDLVLFGEVKPKTNQRQITRALNKNSAGQWFECNSCSHVRSSHTAARNPLKCSKVRGSCGAETRTHTGWKMIQPPVNGIDRRYE